MVRLYRMRLVFRTPDIAPLAILFDRVMAAGLCRANHLFMFLFGLLLTPNVRGDDAAARDTFLKEYGPRAGAIMKAYTNIRVQWVGTEYGDQGIVTQKGEGKFNYDNFLLTGRSSAKDAKTGEGIGPSAAVIEAKNRQYAFMLRRRPNNGYLLAALTMADPKRGGDFCFFSVPYADRDRKMTYLDIGHDRATEFVALRPCVWQQHPMTELVTRFHRIHPGTKKEIVVMHSHYFTPERNWLCHGLRSYAFEAEKSQYMEEYVYDGDGEFPALKSIVIFTGNPSDQAHWKKIRSTEVTEFERCPPFSDADFRLSAFDLPEPNGVTWQQPPSYYLWFGGAAVAALAVALGFRWLAKRRARALPTTRAANSP